MVWIPRLCFLVWYQFQTSQSAYFKVILFFISFILELHQFWFCLASGYVFVCMCHNIFGSLVTNETFVIWYNCLGSFIVVWSCQVRKYLIRWFIGAAYSRYSFWGAWEWFYKHSICPCLCKASGRCFSFSAL